MSETVTEAQWHNVFFINSLRIRENLLERKQKEIETNEAYYPHA
jgi:hypothetical protein